MIPGIKHTQKTMFRRMLFALSITFPLQVSAQSLNLTYADTYANGVIFFINTYLVPLFVAIAFGFFLWGIVLLFFIKSESAQKEGPMFVLWGIIGFVVIFSVWGLVAIVSTTLGLGQTGSTAPAPPTFNTSSGASAPTIPNTSGTQISPDPGTDYSQGY